MYRPCGGVLCNFVHAAALLSLREARSLPRGRLACRAHRGILAAPTLPDGKEIENAIQRSRFRYDLSVRSRLWMAGPLRRASRKSRMHPRGLEPPARRRAFPEGCRRSPTAISKAFTGSCWSWRLLSVTTFRADVAPPHVGSPSVRTRVAGAAKMKRTRHAARALPLRHRSVSGRVKWVPSPRLPPFATGQDSNLRPRRTHAVS